MSEIIGNMEKPSTPLKNKATKVDDEAEHLSRSSQPLLDTTMTTKTPTMATNTTGRGEEIITYRGPAQGFPFVVRETFRLSRNTFVVGAPIATCTRTRGRKVVPPHLRKATKAQGIGPAQRAQAHDSPSPVPAAAVTRRGHSIDPVAVVAAQPVISEEQRVREMAEEQRDAVAQMSSILGPRYVPATVAAHQVSGADAESGGASN